MNEVRVSKFRQALLELVLDNPDDQFSILGYTVAISQIPSGTVIGITLGDYTVHGPEVISATQDILVYAKDKVRSLEDA